MLIHIYIYIYIYIYNYIYIQNPFQKKKAKKLNIFLMEIIVLFTNDLLIYNSWAQFCNKSTSNNTEAYNDKIKGNLLEMKQHCYVVLFIVDKSKPDDITTPTRFGIGASDNYKCCSLNRKITFTIILKTTHSLFLNLFFKEIGWCITYMPTNSANPEK